MESNCALGTPEGPVPPFGLGFIVALGEPVPGCTSSVAAPVAAPTEEQTLSCRNPQRAAAEELSARCHVNLGMPSLHLPSHHTSACSWPAEHPTLADLTGFAGKRKRLFVAWRTAAAICVLLAGLIAYVSCQMGGIRTRTDNQLQRVLGRQHSVCRLHAVSRFMAHASLPLSSRVAPTT